MPCLTLSGAGIIAKIDNANRCTAGQARSDWKLQKWHVNRNFLQHEFTFTVNFQALRINMQPLSPPPAPLSPPQQPMVPEAFVRAWSNASQWPGGVLPVGLNYSAFLLDSAGVMAYGQSAFVTRPSAITTCVITPQNPGPCFTYIDGLDPSQTYHLWIAQS